MAKLIDTKLARRLQKRGNWKNYTSCLREVQKYLSRPEWSPEEVRELIDRGELDPPATPKEAGELE